MEPLQAAMTRKTTPHITDTGDNAVILQDMMREIDRLKNFSTRGLKALALFLVVSSAAWSKFPFLPAAETVTALLGPPPSARIISTVLLIYTFFAIALSVARLTSGIEHRSSFCHVGYLTSFYLFYYFGNTLEDNFLAVCGAGITILGTESYRIWNYCSEGIAEKKEAAEYVSRVGRHPPKE